MQCRSSLNGTDIQLQQWLWCHIPAIIIHNLEGRKVKEESERERREEGRICRVCTVLSAHTLHLPLTCQAGFCSCRVLSEARCLRLDEERLVLEPWKEREAAKDLRILGGLDLEMDWLKLCWLRLKATETDIHAGVVMNTRRQRSTAA